MVLTQETKIGLLILVLLVGRLKVVGNLASKVRVLSPAVEVTKQLVDQG